MRPLSKWSHDICVEVAGGIGRIGGHRGRVSLVIAVINGDKRAGEWEFASYNSDGTPFAPARFAVLIMRHRLR